MAQEPNISKEKKQKFETRGEKENSGKIEERQHWAPRRKNGRNRENEEKRWGGKAENKEKKEKIKAKRGENDAERPPHPGEMRQDARKKTPIKWRKNF